MVRRRGIRNEEMSCHGSLSGELIFVDLVLLDANDGAGRSDMETSYR